MDEEALNVLLVGPLSPPIGGVSSHVERLAAVLATNGIQCTVLDMYADDKKITVPGVSHKVCSMKGKVLPIIWLFFHMGLERCDAVHIHFSRSVGWFSIASVLLIKRRRRVILTLHHGDQAAVFRKSVWPIRVLAVGALRRMDKIVVLSSEQALFYQSVGVPTDRLVRWEVALPLNVTPDQALMPPEVQKLRPIEAGGEETILMTSGYPETYYGYEECVELLDRLSKYMPCKLVISLYGTGTDRVYEHKLRTVLLHHPNVVLVGPMPSAGFLALLAKASVYLRPSKVDSYGLAITDALNVGTPCLASDVCNRDPRCETFPTGNKEAFMRQALKVVTRGRTLRVRPKLDQVDVAHFDYIEKCYR
jgi:glycosyltransferase involved in cell wall biosynthesis